MRAEPGVLYGRDAADPYARSRALAIETIELDPPGVDDLAIGDHVVMMFMPSCSHCLPCAEGPPALCEPGAVANGAGTLLGGATRLHDVDGAIHHRLGCSAFASHALVSRRSPIRIEPVSPLPFGCAVRPTSMLW